MHSHDRTLIASLGFGDPDKRNPRHDLACQYLSQMDVAGKVIHKLFDAGGKELGFRELKVNSEEPLTKGEGQYETIIGFLDIVYTFTSGESDKQKVVVEIKCDRIPVADIIRQMKFYRESSKNSVKLNVIERFPSGRTKGYPLFYLTWIVILDFDISEIEASMFKQEGIRVLKLGENFDKFIEENSNAPDVLDRTWDATDV